MAIADLTAFLPIITKPYFTDAAIEQFFAVKKRAVFRRVLGGDVQLFDKDTDNPIFKLSVHVWREGLKKQVRVFDNKDNVLYSGNVDL